MSIIKDVKNGNEQAFEILIEQHKIPIYKTAKAILKNEDDVCDAIQETLLSVYKNISTLEKEKYFKTWVIRITINKCYDIMEKSNIDNNKVIQMQDKMDLLETDSKEDLKMDLERALKVIDNDLRLIVVLYYYNDISIKGISDILGIPSGTVKSKLARAREKLYDVLSQEEVGQIG